MKGKAIAALAVAAVLLAGCSTELPEPVELPELAAPPVALSEDRAAEILALIGQDIAVADAARDASLLTNRVGGPALVLRTAEYELAKKSESLEFSELSATAQQITVPQANTWPRQQLVITQSAGEDVPPLMYLLRQNSVDEPYQLWNWVRLFPGARIPELPTDAIGNTDVFTDDPVLGETLQNLPAQYADFLVKGADSEFAAMFATEDPFQRYLQSRSDAYANVVSDPSVNGSATFSVEPGQFAAEGVATAEGGGAIVFFTLIAKQNLTFEKATVTLPTDAAAIVGAERVREGVTLEWNTSVALYIPGPDSTETINPLGAWHVLAAGSAIEKVEAESDDDA